MDFVRSVLFAGLGLVLFLLGCGGGSSSCNAPTCDNGYYLPHLQSGTVAWTRNGAPLATADVATDSLGGEFAVLSSTPGKVDNPAYTQSWQWQYTDLVRLKISYNIGCGLGGCKDASITDPGDAGLGDQGWSAELGIFSDPRNWALGEASLRHAFVEEHYYSAFGSFTPVPNGNPADLHVVVTEAVGGASDFPTLVTPDFLRVFQLSYAGVPDKDTGVEAAVSLTLTLTATDFTPRREPCWHCR